MVLRPNIIFYFCRSYYMKTFQKVVRWYAIFIGNLFVNFYYTSKTNFVFLENTKNLYYWIYNYEVTVTLSKIIRIGNLKNAPRLSTYVSIVNLISYFL